MCLILLARNIIIFLAFWPLTTGEAVQLFTYVVFMIWFLQYKYTNCTLIIYTELHSLPYLDLMIFGL